LAREQGRTRAASSVEARNDISMSDPFELVTRHTAGAARKPLPILSHRSIDPSDIVFRIRE
jgi:hypothetical protein